MKKTFFILALLLFYIVSKADFVFDSNKSYRIIALDLSKGGIEPASGGNYPLIYNINASENRKESLWIIKEEKPDKYSFKNLKTGQYIKYEAGNSAGKFIKMSNKLEEDLTLFTIKNIKTKDDVSYWAISPVSNPKVIFDRRKYNAVGPYQAQHTNNQLFLIKEQNGNYLKAPSLLYEPNKYLKSFTLNNTELIYDTKQKIYYCSIPIEQMNSNVTKKVNYIPRKAGYTLKIEKQMIKNGATFTFTNTTADKVFNIYILEKDSIIQSTKLIFTGLPIVQLYMEDGKWSKNFSKGKIKVTENNVTTTGELLDADVRYRGATALGYSKKSFAIKLKDENRKNIDRSYFGLRNDNYWILDAMASDLSRMRNRVCTDLWNDFSTNPYFKDKEKNMINGTRGQFVEVFWNNQYWGLYCMTERVDRKQLKLKKYNEELQKINGVLYKSGYWTSSVMMGKAKARSNYNLPSYKNSSPTWDGYEVKYPDLKNKEKMDWKPLYDVISFVANENNTNFKKNITEYIDLPVWLDYYLFLELIYAQDNHGKNVYFYIYDINKDKKLGLTPWDLDGTWGRNWDRMKSSSRNEYYNFMRNHYYGEHHIYRRLRETNAENYNFLLKKRYNELKSNYFSKESLNKRLDDYLKLFTVSGVKKREEARWRGSDNVSLHLDNEIDYMKKWISERVDFLNSQYK